MGSLQSKVKEGYNIKQRPIFKSKFKCGSRPSFANQLKRSSASSLTYGYLDPKASFQPIRHSSCTNETQGEEPDFPIQNNSLEYPFTAIGLISCIVSGSARRSTGALIASNVVVTAAHNLFCMDSQSEVQRVSFHLRTSSGQLQEYNAQKIFIPDEFKAGMQDNMSPRELSRFDFGILLLETHVDVNKSGTLGFDFTFAPRENCQNVFIYGFHKRGAYLQIDGWRINASVGEKMIRYSVNGSIDSMGGPIVEFKDENYSIIGIQNGVYRQEHLYQKKAMKLSQEMFDHMTQWITHEQEEIDIRDKELGKEGIKKLVKFKWTTLSTINLARNNLGKEGLKYLTRCEWNNLHHLDIGGNDISKEGVKYLVEVDMKNLQTLNMWGNGIEAEGALLLLNGNWKQLNCINLYNNELDNEGMRYIVKANWSQLENINLGKNKITDAGIRLVACSNWRNVVSLNIWGNLIKDPKTTSFELKKHLGKLKFLYL